MSLSFASAANPPAMKEGMMEYQPSHQRVPLKPADRESIDRLLHHNAREAAVKLYAGAYNCDLDEARRELAVLIASKHARPTGDAP